MLAALGLFAGAAAPASAADLGGDCCADLEERIAELEATTARKGNRKVSLEVSGHVNQAILWFDNGDESNAGVYTNDNARTRFRFKGDAKITDGWKAGYLLEIGVRAAHSGRFDQDNDNAQEDDNGLDIRHSTWFIDSKSYGRVWVGLTGGANEGVTEINLAATKDVLKYSDLQDTGGGIRPVIGNDQVGIEWRNLIGAGGSGSQAGEGARYNLVRYDTPEIFGFTGTVSWGEDDTREVGLRYKGEFNSIKIAAGIAYGENTDGDNSGDGGGYDCAITGGAPGKNADADCEYVGGSISVMHSPTGLYANFGAGQVKDNLVSNFADGEGLDGDDTSSFYAIEAGIEQKWNALGKTTIFGQYHRADGGFQDRDFDDVGTFGGDFILGSEIEGYAVGVIQGVDAAAMHIYLTYRHYEGEVTTEEASAEFEDLDVVMGGAIIRF
ncbi:MAG: hypothetical protein CTY31_12640 [Hyphomicrobium sp.]|nr:MAG: hypothetical protein CTY31_12640 [Hyphomicrobium sp.]